VKLDKAVAREIKQLAYRERKKRMFRKISHVLNPSATHGGLTRVDIPASGIDEPFPKGPDPKTWNGPWKSITNPDNIALHVCAANHRQYHQAHITPFASEPLLSYFGYCGNKPGADALLAGRLPPSSILDSLLPETKQILTTLAQPGLSTPKLPSSISTQEFKALYKILPEAISSSPSGRHLGHYKVASTWEPLAEFHAKMMSIPYLAGFSPQRWHQVVDIMLEKNPGDPKIHRLRIIHWGTKLPILKNKMGRSFNIRLG
jgi:hypothetical protein